MAKKGSKNNIENRGTGSKIKQLNGRAVEPVYYAGKNRNHHSGMFAAYSDNGELVYNSAGQPVKYDEIPQ